MVLVGITGTHGAGKGTITNHLVREHGFVSVSVSEFLATEAEKRGMKPDRSARRNIANEYRTQGPTALMEAVYASIDTTAERVILEPQYTVEEVQYIQNLGGIVIALDADIEVRYKRVHVRGSAKDDVTFKEFKTAQEKEMDSTNSNEQNLVATMKAADFHVKNSGSVDGLEQEVAEKILPKLL